MEQAKQKRSSRKVIEKPDSERSGLPSASSMDAMIRCLGRKSICEKMNLEPSKKSEYADRGEKIHAVLEGKLNIEEISNSDKWTVGKIMNEEGRIVDKYNFQGAEVIREKRLWELGENMQPIFSARLDCVYLK